MVCQDIHIEETINHILLAREERTLIENTTCEFDGAWTKPICIIYFI